MVRLMLYKKIHRQFLRQFRVGRKFEFYGRVGVVVNPHIGKTHITIGCSNNISLGGIDYTKGFCLGRMWYQKDENMIWLED